MNRWGRYGLLEFLILLPGGFMNSGAAGEQPVQQSPQGGLKEREAISGFVDQHCVACHNRDEKTAGLALDAISAEDVSRNSNDWEKVVRKLVARQMPPEGEVRPSKRTYDVVRLRCSQAALDRAAAERPNPGRTGHIPAAQPDRVPERHPRPPGARHRRHDVTADRRVESRLRQRDGGRPLADAPGPLHHRGTEDQPAGGRSPGPVARRRHDPDPAGPHPGGARRGAADRDARRGLDSVHVSAGRRVRDPASPGAGPQRACRGPARAA